MTLFKTTFLGTCLSKNVKEFEIKKREKAILNPAPNGGFFGYASKKLVLPKTHFLKNCLRRLKFLNKLLKIYAFT